MNNIPTCSDTASRLAAFDHLQAHVQVCRRCVRMEGRRRVLGPANGPLHARALFVAEAPGRLGAERCAIPLAGDQSGRNFERFLHAAGLQRCEVFLTNAVLCNPQDAQGRNATPTARELCNCSAHLAAVIDIVQLCPIVTLGTVALRALHLIASHTIVLARDVGQVRPWHGRLLVPLYHPGARSRIHRSEQLQLEDYRRMGAVVRGVGDRLLQ